MHVYQAADLIVVEYVQYFDLHTPFLSVLSAINFVWVGTLEFEAVYNGVACAVSVFDWHPYVCHSMSYHYFFDAQQPLVLSIVKKIID